MYVLQHAFAYVNVDYLKVKCSPYSRSWRPRWGVGVQPYSFFNLEARCGWWSMPSPYIFTSEKETRYQLQR